MKLKPTPPIFAARLSKKLSKLSKELKYSVIETRDVDFNALIVLGNGDVDDLVMSILCHHLNGVITAGITKPKETRVGVIKNFPIYISNLKINKILLVMDQEDDQINTIHEQIEDKLRKLNIRFEFKLSESSEAENRVRKYNCSYGSRSFDFMLVVSGLDEIPVNKHRIEDHLVKSGRRLNLIDTLPREDTKLAWKSYNRPQKNEILNRLLTNKSFSRDTFPQHFRGLEFIKDEVIKNEKAQHYYLDNSNTCRLHGY